MSYYTSADGRAEYESIHRECNCGECEYCTGDDFTGPSTLASLRMEAEA